MHDVGVVPHGLRGDLGCANLHSQVAAEAGQVIIHAIESHQRAPVVVELGVDVGIARRATEIFDVDVTHRIGVDADDAAIVVVERVVDDDRLRSSHKHD